MHIFIKKLLQRKELLKFFIYKVTEISIIFHYFFTGSNMSGTSSVSNWNNVTYNDPITLTCSFCYSMSSGAGMTPIITWMGQNCGSGTTSVNSSSCATSSITIQATRPQLQTCTASFSPPCIVADHDQNPPVFVTPTFLQSPSGIIVNCKFHLIAI